MFEKYMSSRNSKNVINEAAAPLQQAGQSSASQEGLEQAHSKRLRDVLDLIHGDKKLFDHVKYQLALAPEEMVSFLEWAKKKVGGAGEAEEGGDVGEISGGDGPMGEAVEKADKEIEAAKNLKPKSEETEEEYLERRDRAIKAAIAAKEEAEEQMTMQSHYNTQNHALDLVDGLLKSPKKYQKADAIKILSLALDKLNGKS